MRLAMLTEKILDFAMTPTEEKLLTDWAGDKGIAP